MADAVLVTADDLAAELAGTRPPVVLDVRWRLGGPPGHGDYLTGHIPGAVYVDLDTELASHGQPTDGRHPLPSPDVLQAAVRRWGIDDGDRVVAYDGQGNLAAARAWWLLRWAGVTDVRILDGGLGAWTAADGALDSGPHTPEQGDVELSGGRLPVVDADEVAAWPAHGVLLDARAGERYRGEVEPVDARAGHVPGAVSLPTADNLNADRTFRSGAELRHRFAAAGVGGDVAVYCGSGVTAAHEIAALHLAGIDAALYPGSWSAWSGDPDRPVATGPR